MLKFNKHSHFIRTNYDKNKRRQIKKKGNCLNNEMRKWQNLVTHDPYLKGQLMQKQWLID